jgi:hypothetical protein
VAVHDQEGACADLFPPATLESNWPEGLLDLDSDIWGLLRFGLPPAPPDSPPGSPGVTIRQGLNGAVVPDAAVGGTIPRLCPGDPDFIWNLWANRNYGAETDFLVQNQADLADWPCFAKYYVSFPLDLVPGGKTILSARLTLRHWGGSDGNFALPSLLQISSVAEDWSETSLTWNNAPLALENISRVWEDPFFVTTWPAQAVTWDVTAAVLRAYSRGEPVRLALYSADAARHSGKYFNSSETEDWNAVSLPTLVVTWAAP